MKKFNISSYIKLFKENKFKIIIKELITIPLLILLNIIVLGIYSEFINNTLIYKILYYSYNILYILMSIKVFFSLFNNSNKPLLNRIISVVIKTIYFIILTVLLSTLILLLMLLFISIYLIFTHLLFLGISLIILGLVLINLLFMILLYKKIFNINITFKIKYIKIIVIMIVLGLLEFLISYNNINKIDNLLLNNTEDNKRFNNISEIKYSNHKYTFIINNEIDSNIDVSLRYNSIRYSSRITIDEDIVNVKYNDNFKDKDYLIKYILNNLKNNKLVSYKSSIPEIIIEANQKNINQLIKNMSDKRLSKLDINDDTYILNFLADKDENHTLCYLENKYYYKCVYIYKPDGVKISEFKYNKKGLEYDKEKYTCDIEDNIYYCYTTEGED